MNKTISLPLSLDATGSDSFDAVFKKEVKILPENSLPLQQGLQHSSMVKAGSLDVVVLNVEQHKETVTVKAGLFYSGIIAGCSCADDPSPQDEINEYCEVQFSINRTTALTDIILLP